MKSYDIYVPIVAHQVYRIEANTSEEAIENFCQMVDQEPERIVIEVTDCAYSPDPERVEVVV